MGHHIDEQGRFQSDKYPDLPPDRIVLSFDDPRAQQALFLLAEAYRGHEDDLAEDITARLVAKGCSPIDERARVLAWLEKQAAQHDETAREFEQHAGPFAIATASWRIRASELRDAANRLRDEQHVPLVEVEP